MRKLFITQVDFEITTKCNLNCEYCYLGKEGYPKEHMSDEIMLKAISLIKRYGVWKNRQGMNATRFMLYGGEPLLNWEGIKKLVELTRGDGFEGGFTIMSNGTIGTPEMAEFVKANGMTMQRSIDGCHDAQEISRPGTYNKYQEVTKVFGDQANFKRMTISPKTAKYLLKSLMEHEQNGVKKFQMMPAFEADWTDEAKKDFKDQLWEIGKYFVERFRAGEPFDLYYLRREASARFGGYGKDLFCAAGRSLACVTFDGYVTICHRFARYPKDGPYCYGHLNDILAGKPKGYSAEVEHMLEQVDAKIIPIKCRGCEVSDGCQHGCYATDEQTTGVLTDAPPFWCEVAKETGKVVLWIDDQLRAEDRNWWMRNNLYVEQSKQNQSKNCNCNTQKSNHSHPKAVPIPGKPGATSCPCMCECDTQCPCQVVSK